MIASPGASRAHDRWAAAAGPWRRWMIAIPLLAPSPDSPPALASIRPSARARRLAATLDSSVEARPTLLVLDLPPVLGLAIATLLAERGTAHPVLYLLRWPYPRAILATARLRALLVAGATRLPGRLHARSAVVVLDGQRDRPVPRRAPFDRRVDNRYEISAADLPDAQVLAAAGIDSVRLAATESPERRSFAAEVERQYAGAGLAFDLLTVG